MRSIQRLYEAEATIKRQAALLREADATIASLRAELAIAELVASEHADDIRLTFQRETALAWRAMAAHHERTARYLLSVLNGIAEAVKQ